MRELIERLEKDKWHVSGVDIQEAINLIESQAASIEHYKSGLTSAIQDIEKYKALCDQMGNALHFSHEETKGWYEEVTGEDYNSPIINEALEAWRALK